MFHSRTLNSIYQSEMARSIAGMLLLVSAAIVIGEFVGQENWIYLAVIGALPLVALWPVQIALGVFALLVPFDQIALVGSGAGATTLTWFVGIGSTLVLLTVGLIGQRIQRPPNAALWWSVFVIWGAITCLWAVDLPLAYSRLPTAFSLLALFLIAVSLRVKDNERFCIVVLTILGGCVAAAFTIREFYQGATYTTTGRASILIGEQQTDPNGLAASLLLPLSLAIALFFAAQKRTSKMFWLGAVTLMGFGILLTMSRGGVIGLIVIGFVYLRRLKKWRAAVPVLLIAPLLWLLPESFFQRISESVATGGAGRLSIWSVGAILLKKYGLIGAGINNFLAVFYSYAGYYRGPHNIYLGTWVELGIAGLILLLVAAGSQLKQVWRQRVKFYPILVGAEAACWAVLVSGLFLDVIWRKYFWLSWILLAISAQKSGSSQLKEHPELGLQPHSV